MSDVQAAESQHSKEVCFLLRELPVGGLETVVLTLVNECVSRDMKVKVVLYGAGDNANLDNLAPNVELIELRGSPLRKAWMFRRHAGGAVIHYHISEGRLLALLRLIAPPHGIVTHHNVYRRHCLADLVEGLLCRRARQVIAVSDEVASAARRRLRVPPHKVKTVLNAVRPVEELAHDAAPQEVSRGQAVHFLAVARCTHQKDYPTLLRAMRIVQETRPDATLTVVGDGGELSRCQTMARDLGLTGVTWLGEITEPAAIAKMRVRHPVFVTASRWEGYSLSVLEAMAYSQVVVASDLPSHRQQLGLTSLFFHVGDAAALAKHLLALAEDDRLCRRLGEENRVRLAQELYAQFVTDHMQIYEAS